MTDAAVLWATNRVEAIEGTPASIARQFGVSWSTVWNAVARLARSRVDDPARVGPTAMVGFDETVMQPASRRRRRRFITAVVDVDSGQILDVFEGHDAKHLRAWMTAMPAEWLALIEVVSVDPHEGYRSALVNPDPATGELSALVEATVVVDPFHMVRLANAAVTRCRTRVQQETLVLAITESRVLRSAKVASRGGVSFRVVRLAAAPFRGVGSGGGEAVVFA